MARAFVFAIARLEMTAVITGIDDDGILIHPKILQFIAHSTNRMVKGMAASEIISIVLNPVARQPSEVTGDIKIGPVLLGPFRSLVTVMIILMMGFNIGDEQKKGFVLRLLIKVFLNLIGLRVNPVAVCREKTGVATIVEHVPIVGMRGILQDIGCQPVVIATTESIRHG